LNKTWKTLCFEIKSKLQADKQNYIFFDEIQNIADFEKLVDGLYASKNIDITHRRIKNGGIVQSPLNNNEVPHFDYFIKNILNKKSGGGISNKLPFF